MKQVSLFFICLLLLGCKTKESGDVYTELHNPILPGYFADPSIVEFEGKFYMYATIDPWGGESLSCWESDDFENWTYHELNWPTKAACTSPLSNHNNVWAPSVIKKDNLFYMYISVGSEIWCGTATHPLGPWKNMLDNRPMIAFDTSLYYHVIDAEVFIDDDGKTYLYWGSGWEWTNGHCFAAELNEDMATFKSEPIDVTPKHYFEGPLMLKHNGKYYLTYSEGKTIDETYEVRYAVGDNPYGPFEEAQNSPILKTDNELDVYGPGHHTVFQFQGKNYILYHRHSLPFNTGTAMRQICINEIEYDNNLSQIKTITPALKQPFPKLSNEKTNTIIPKKIWASSENKEYTQARHAIDNSYATRWECKENDSNPSLTVEFSDTVSISTVIIRPEYPWKTYFIKAEISSDNTNWEIVSDYTSDGIAGSPILLSINRSTKYIKLSFGEWNDENKPSIWEISFNQ